MSVSSVTCPQSVAVLPVAVSAFQPIVWVLKVGQSISMVITSVVNSVGGYLRRNDGEPSCNSAGKVQLRKIVEKLKDTRGNCCKSQAIVNNLLKTCKSPKNKRANQNFRRLSKMPGKKSQLPARSVSSGCMALNDNVLTSFESCFFTKVLSREATLDSLS